LNRIFYVKEITHSFSYGGDCKTSLGLSYGHVPWDVLPELLTYYDDKFGLSEPYRNRYTLKFGEYIPSTATEEKTQQIGRSNEDIQYIIIHHLGHDLKGRTFDFIITQADIYTTQQWAPRLNSDVPFNYRHLLHKKPHLMPNELTVDFGSSDNYDLTAKSTMHVCLWGDLLLDLFSRRGKWIQINLIKFLTYLLIAIFNSNGRAGFSNLESLENPEDLMTRIKSHGSLVSNACTVGCCGNLVTTESEKKILKRDTSIESLFNEALQQYHYFLNKNLYQRLE